MRSQVERANFTQAASKVSAWNTIREEVDVDMKVVFKGHLYKHKRIDGYRPSAGRHAG